MNNVNFPLADEAKYLGIHLDRRLTWKKHIWTKRKQLNLKLSKLYWLLGRNSKLSLDNKVLVYKTILKPVWTYGIELWGSASISNIEILQRFQSKVLRTISESPWYVCNDDIHRSLEVPTVRTEIVRFSDKYLNRLERHPNSSALNLLDNSENINRLKRQNVLELKYRFI